MKNYTSSALYRTHELHAPQIRGRARDKVKAQVAVKHNYHLRILWELEVKRDNWSMLDRVEKLLYAYPI